MGGASEIKIGKDFPTFPCSPAKSGNSERLRPLLGGHFVLNHDLSFFNLMCFYKMLCRICLNYKEKFEMEIKMS